MILAIRTSAGELLGVADISDMTWHLTNAGCFINEKAIKIRVTIENGAFWALRRLEIAQIINQDGNGIHPPVYLGRGYGEYVRNKDTVVIAPGELSIEMTPVASPLRVDQDKRRLVAPC